MEFQKYDVKEKKKEKKERKNEQRKTNKVAKIIKKISCRRCHTRPRACLFPLPTIGGGREEGTRASACQSQYNYKTNRPSPEHNSDFIVERTEDLRS